MWPLTFLIILILCFSFLCSLAEAAILSVPLLRVRILVERKRHGARDLLYVKENIALAVASLVIINNGINIIGSMFIGQQITLRYGNHWLGVVSGVLTFLIIILGEVIPKAIGERFKTPVALMVAKVVRILSGVLQPLVQAIMAMLKWWTPDFKTPRVTEEEIKMMLKLGRDAGTVEIDEAELCNRVFRLKDLLATHIMVPLKDAFMLPVDKTLAEAKEKIILSSHHHLVVYDQNPANIVGIVDHRILLREIAKGNDNSKISAWMFKPIFVNQMLKADALMEKFQTFHQHLLIVQNNIGQNIGLVSMEDVSQELFGEIYDDKDAG
ncbi:MAG: DUF21 domain-containing protein [Candidatus Omnitrophica bacterium]|nr:DUF21 domain-containing protein [Candidatus Omnitrophota bacterium]